MILGPNLKYLAAYLINYKKNLVLVLCSLIAVAVSLLLLGVVFRRLIDQAIIINDVTEIYRTIFLATSLISVFSVGSFFRSYFINVITIKIIAKLKISIYESLFRVDISQYEELKIGDLISRLSADMELVASLIINFLSFFVRNSLMLSGAIILMFVQTVKLSLLVTFLLPILLLPLLKLSRYIRSVSRLLLKEQGELSANIDENFGGIRTIYAYNQQDNIIKKFYQAVDAYIQIAVKRQYFRSLFFALAIILITGTMISVVAIGSIDIARGNITAGQMISFIYYAMIVGFSAGGIAELFSEIQSPLAALDRVMELKNLAPQQKIKLNQPSLDNIFSTIEFINVNFAYPTRPAILALNNLSFKIKNGEFIGIAGQSGAGKSSIMQLLLKFYSPNQGKIFLGNENIETIDAIHIRRKIAYIEQTPTIFSGTIRDNIIFTNPTADEESLKQVVRLTGIDEFTANLTNGIDTEIGQKGVRLSGGQKQRIAIARALLYQPEILMLDEATSALDNESEQKIMTNLKKILVGKTIIAIAHRLSTIKEADQILLINCGKLAATGSHEQLLASSELYNTLCQVKT